MPSGKDYSSSPYRSNVWERSFLLGICSVLTVGILYGLNTLLADEPQAAGDDASGGNGDGDGDE